MCDPMMHIIGWSTSWKGAMASRSALIRMASRSRSSSGDSWRAGGGFRRDSRHVRLAPPSRTHYHGSSHQGTDQDSICGFAQRCFFPQFAALCWCLPILVGAEVDFPSAQSTTGEAAEKAPEGAKEPSRQTRQSVAPESYSFQVTLISSFPNLISTLPEHQNRSRRSKRAPIGCARD